MIRKSQNFLKGCRVSWQMIDSPPSHHERTSLNVCLLVFYHTAAFLSMVATKNERRLIK
jgi:hypothetical protein